MELGSIWVWLVEVKVKRDLGNGNEEENGRV